MATYVKITHEEFDAFMTHYGFVCMNPDQAQQEFIYSTTWNDGEYMLKVYSSITDMDDARDVGKDAIRLTLFTLQGQFYAPCLKGKRVYRVKGWKANLINGIAIMEHIGIKNGNWQCENCGGHLLIRTGRRGEFYGCENFPTSRGGCRYTRSL